MAFFTSAKANEEIERLTKALDEATVENKTLEETAAKFSGELETAKTDLTTAQAALKTAQESIAALTNEKTALSEKIKTLEATIADPKGEIAKRAGAQAAEISASQGAPPVPVPVENAPGAKGKTEGLTGFARAREAFAQQLTGK